MYDMIPERTSLISSFFEMLKAWSKGPATKRGLLARQFLENRHILNLAQMCIFSYESTTLSNSYAGHKSERKDHLMLKQILPN